MQYEVIAYADNERGLKRQEIVINAHNEDEAWTRAWMAFPEYKELLVTRKE